MYKDTPDEKKTAEPALQPPLLHPILHSAELHWQTSEPMPLDDTVVGALILTSITYVCVSIMAIANTRKFLNFVVPCVLLLQCYSLLFASATPIPLSSGVKDPFSGAPGDQMPGGNEFTEP